MMVVKIPVRHLVMFPTMADLRKNSFACSAFMVSIEREKHIGFDLEHIGARGRTGKAS